MKDRSHKNRIKKLTGHEYFIEFTICFHWLKMRTEVKQKKKHSQEWMAGRSTFLQDLTSISHRCGRSSSRPQYIEVLGRLFKVISMYVNTSFGLNVGRIKVSNWTRCCGYFNVLLFLPGFIYWESITDMSEYILIQKGSNKNFTAECSGHQLILTEDVSLYDQRR